MNERLGVELVSIIMDEWILKVLVLKEHGLNEGEIVVEEDEIDGMGYTKRLCSKEIVRAGIPPKNERRYCNVRECVGVLEVAMSLLLDISHKMKWNKT